MSGMEINVSKEDLTLNPKLFKEGDVLNFHTHFEIVYYIGNKSFVTTYYQLYDDYIYVNYYGFKKGALNLQNARSEEINLDDPASKKYTDFLEKRGLK